VLVLPNAQEGALASDPKCSRRLENRGGFDVEKKTLEAKSASS
jgi:hypothetical protein